MQFILLAIFSLAACVSASIDTESPVGFHEKVAIPMATKIKAEEEAVLANKNTNERIAGGILSKDGSHPYMAGLIISYVNNPGLGVCGATLVSNTRLISAAHCWFDFQSQASRFVVVLGTNMLFSGGRRIPTSKVVTYPDWSSTNSQNNMAVIYLPTSVLLTRYIQPIAIDKPSNETHVGSWAVAVGFGKSSDTQTSVPVLSAMREVEVQVMSNEDCQKVYPNRVHPNTLCTNGTGGIGLCKGDGGGPLVMTHEGQQVVIAVNAFVATPGCEKGYPSGYSRVSSFYDFIMEHL